MTDDQAGDFAPLSEANAPEVTMIWDAGQQRELLRMPGFFPLPVGAIVQLGKHGDGGNPPSDGVVVAIRLWRAAPGATPLLRLDVMLRPPGDHLP